MVKLDDLSPGSVRHLLDKDCAEFETAPFVAGPPLRERRVAIVTTAGLHRRDDRNFDVSDLSYRVIPGDVRLDDLVMTQASVNFDRTGFQQDVNVVLPLDRLREMQMAGEIGEIMLGPVADQVGRRRRRNRRGQRRQGDAAIAGDHRGHPLADLARHVRIRQHGAIVMGMNVDKPRRHGAPRRVDLDPAGGSRQIAHRHDPVVGHGDIGDARLRPRPVDHPRAPDDDVGLVNDHNTRLTQPKPRIVIRFSVARCSHSSMAAVNVEFARSKTNTD